jgi:hypothetical protein
MPLNKEEQEYYETQRVEQERREDFEYEREFWTNVMLAILSESDATIKKAVEQADEALRLYRERFQ